MPTFSASDGTRLAYALTGEGPPLICHPGGPGRAVAYLEDLAGLSAHRTLVLFDPRGTGHSAAPADPYSFTPQRLADDVDDLRRELGLETVELLGHSAGGRVAQVYASSHPERLSSLVLVCSSASTATASTTSQAAEAEAERAAIRRRRSDEPWYAEAAEAASALHYASAAERGRLERMTRPFWYGRWDERCRQHAASADGQLNLRFAAVFLRAPMPELHLERMSAPVLVVGGELDVLTPPVTARDLAHRFPAAQLTVIGGAGHFPWVDEPVRFREAVGAFLDPAGAAA